MVLYGIATRFPAGRCLAREIPINTYIALRRAPNWSALAEVYRAEGRVAPELYLPPVLPIGFPGDLPRLIDLWNSLFRLDFFSVRARLAALARRSWEAVAGARVLEVEALPQVTNAVLGGEDSLVCFVDDDDWFAPTLHSVLSSQDVGRYDSVRWAAPMFNGHLLVRFAPRLLPKLAVSAYRRTRGNVLAAALWRRALGLTVPAGGIPITPGDLLFASNNYAITSKYVRMLHGYAAVLDHVEASRLFLHSQLRVKSMPNQWLSLTNKHPCSAGAIGHAAVRDRPAEALHAYVRGFAEDAAGLSLPPGLTWARPYIEDTRATFAEALGSS